MGLFVNKEYISHALAEFAATIPGKGVKKYLGMTAVNYSDELKRILVYGCGPVPLGSAVGAYEASADVEFLKDEGQRLIDDIGDGYGLVSVSFMVTYRPLTTGKLYVDAIPSCNITKVEDSSSVGDQANKMKVTLLPQGVISRNGKQVVYTRRSLTASVNVAATLGI